jgi:AcrR family transcriptional regulator
MNIHSPAMNDTVGRKDSAMVTTQRQAIEAAAPGEQGDPGEAARAARTTARTRQLLDSATRLMVRDGSHGVSMQSIADEAHVSVGLIYRYFSNKQDLVQAVIVDVLDDVAARLPDAVGAVDDPVRRIAAAFEAYCRIIDDRREAALLTYRESKTLDRDGQVLIKDREIQTAAPLRDAIVEAQREGLLRPLDPDVLAEDFVLLAHGWALKHWYYAPRLGFEGYVAHHRSTVLSGLITEQHRADYADLLGPLT